MTPKEVKKYSLLDVCDLIAGRRAEKVEDGSYFAFGAGIKPIGMTDQANCEANTIRLTRKGTIGNVYLHKDPFWMDESAYSVEPREMIDKMYLFHWLRMKQPELANCADGTIMPKLSLVRLSKIEIEVPDIDYQLQAVKILDTLQKMRNGLSRIR